MIFCVFFFVRDVRRRFREENYERRCQSLSPGSLVPQSESRVAAPDPESRIPNAELRDATLDEPSCAHFTHDCAREKTAMLSSERRWLTGLLAAAVTLLPVSAQAQRAVRSFDESIPEVLFALSEPLTEPAGLRATTMARGWLQRAADREVARLTRSTAFADSALRPPQQSGAQKRSWIGRHPALFGALVGFGGGFLIGYLPGDDGVFDDFTAGFNGLVLGGVGAGTGAVAGAVVGALSK